MKTFIRRPGNKSNHLKYIIPFIPEFTGTYIEPFLGTGAVFLHLLPSKAILNDINTNIINIWKLVKLHPELIMSEIEKFKEYFLPLSNTDKLNYCKKIVLNMDTYDGHKRTIMYLLMNYCSFNGTLMNSMGEWHISGLNGHIYNNESCHIFTETYKQKLIDLHAILQDIHVENTDYIHILRKAKTGDFVFLDPPYVEDRNYAFKYNKTEKFQVEVLKKELDRLTRLNVKWLMTQADTIEMRSLFENYNIKSYSNNSSYRHSKNVKNELVITNY